jgi:hypothetical protein
VWRVGDDRLLATLSRLLILVVRLVDQHGLLDHWGFLGNALFLLHLEEPLELLTLEHRILIVYNTRLLLDLRRLLGCLECLALLHHHILLLRQLLLLLRGSHWLHLHWLRAERLHGLMRLLHLACLLVELHEVGMHVATLNLRRAATHNFICHLQHLHMTHLTEVWLRSLDDLGLSN